MQINSSGASIPLARWQKAGKIFSLTVTVEGTKKHATSKDVA